MGKKLFDFCIGNPPYQDSTSTNNRQSAVYPFFYDSAEKIANRYILISPARFLFSTGLTQKEWNQKMLMDTHLKVEDYISDSSDVFPNTDIKGGVAIIYRDKNKKFGAIEEFIPDEHLRTIVKHFKKDIEHSLSSIIYGGRSDLKFNKLFLNDYPNSKQDRLYAIQKKHSKVIELSPNEEYELKSSTMEVLSYVFNDDASSNNANVYRILGLVEGKRVIKTIPEKYMTPRYSNNNIMKYKVMVPESNGSGEFGEVLSSPLVAVPRMSATPTFISIGCFNTEIEANNLLKYIKTKLVRTLLGVLKKTQHNAAPNWSYVPLQDFTSSSDIDWSQSIYDIDQQLYKKYGLSQEEIDFIEKNVKEMV